MEKNNFLSEELKGKLIDLDRYTAIIWDMSPKDPDYRRIHDICKNLQTELMCVYGLSAQMINDLTYGEGGVIYG